MCKVAVARVPIIRYFVVKQKIIYSVESGHK